MSLPIEEQWRPVVGFEGAYEVSDLGRVRSLDRVVADITGRERHWPGKILALQVDEDGRRQVGLHFAGKHRRCLAHTLVLEAFVGPRPDGMECCHNNGDCSDNRLQNLRWDTKSENMYDQVRHGTNRESIKTHCPRRHPLEMPNLTATSVSRGYRNCLACNRAHGDVSYAARKGRPAPDFVARSDYHYARIMRGQHNAAA